MMSKNRSRRGYWTIESSMEEAKKYIHRSDFKKASNRAYNVLREHKLLDEACKHMTPVDGIKKWTKEECAKAAKQCKTKSEFMKKFNGAYAISKKRGWYKEFLQHFTPVGSKYKRCIYVCEFTDNHAYVGLTYNFEKRQRDHLHNSDSSVFKHIKLTNLVPVFKQITDYLDYQEAAIKEGEILKEYENNGWVMLNCAPTGGLGSKSEVVRKWTKEKCIELAKSCSSYKEFREEHAGAFAFCERHGMVDSIKEILPMIRNAHKPTKWTKEKALNECKKYTTIKEFRTNNSNAYCFIMRNNLKNEMYKILKSGQFCWTFEEAHKEALKYEYKKDFRENSHGCYLVSLRHGWLDTICSHMKNIQEERIIYNSTNVKETVQKYSYMQQLRNSKDKFVRGCYWWLKKKNLIQEYKQYLKKDISEIKKIHWTDEMLYEECKKYSSYKDFRENSRSYSFCIKYKKLGIIKKYFER